MNPSNRSRGRLLALLVTALFQPALANTGHVDFAIGDITVTSADGRVQPLGKGAELKNGDRVASGHDGRAQVRFSDGAYVSVQPNSEFDITEYRFEGRSDGGDSAVFALRRGALRTTAGLAGRASRDAHRIATPAATVGIGGNGGVVQVDADGSTLITCTSGVWSLVNRAGSLEVPAGTSGFADGNGRRPPRRSIGSPTIPPPQPALREEPRLVAGDKRTADGSPLILPQSGTGFAIATSEPNVVSILTPASVTFDTAGRLTSYTDGLTGRTTLDGANADFGTDGVLAWGRWIGSVTKVFQTATTTTFNEFQGLHYVAGLPTPFSALPKGGTITYGLIGATRPTFTDGQAPVGVLNSASLTADFTRGSVDLKVNAAAGGGTFIGTAIGMPIMNVNGRAAFATNITPGVVTTGGTGCNGCGFGATGFFAGAGATHAGVAYSFSGILHGGNLTELLGAAAFAH
jgi:FecR-like protein